MKNSIKKAMAILLISATAMSVTITPSIACQGSFCSDRAKAARDAYTADQLRRQQGRNGSNSSGFETPALIGIAALAAFAYIMNSEIEKHKKKQSETKK